MSVQQVSYLTKESLRTLVRHKGVMFLSVIIMSLSLLVLAVFLMATDNVSALLDKTKQDFRIYVYLGEDTSQGLVEARHKEFLVMEEVASIVFVSKSEALDEFRRDLGDDQYILETLESNPLPASFKIALKEDYKSIAQIEAFVGRIAKEPGVEEVSYGREYVERFSMMAKMFLYIDAVLGVIVLLSSVFIISNTVRLTILSRRKSIEILKLVGATNRFITTPFIIEGAVQGGLAALLSLGLLAVIHSVVQRIVPDITFLSSDKIALYLVSCIALGSIGSYAALRRFLKL